MGSGNTLCIFHPFDAQRSSTDGATFDLRNGHPVLDFDDTVQETVNFTAIMPRHYSGGGITVYVHWSASTATSGTIGWEISLERIGDSQQDIDSDGFASANTVTAADVPGTSGHVEITNVTFTAGVDMDSIAAGEGFRLRIARDVDNDDASGDAELVAIEIKET